MSMSKASVWTGGFGVLAWAGLPTVADRQSAGRAQQLRSTRPYRVLFGNGWCAARCPFLGAPHSLLYPNWRSKTVV